MSSVVDMASLEKDLEVVSEKIAIGGEKNPGIETPRSSFGEFDLPCGYLAEDGLLHTRIALSGLDGEDEDLMFSNMSAHEIVDRVIGRHLECLGTLPKAIARRSIRDFTAGDRVFLMIMLRRVSIGDSFKWTMPCPACEEKIALSFDLRDLEVRKMADPHRRVYEEILPSGAKVRWKVLNGHMEAQRDKTQKKHADDRMTFAMSLRIESLNDEPINDTPVSITKLRRLSMRDRNWLRKRFNEAEGGIETDIQVGCPKCGKEFETELEVGNRGFFFPTE